MNPVPNPGQIEEDREASLAFWGMEPCIFDGNQGTAALAEWLHNMEIIFRLCHIGAHLQIMLGSRCLVGEARSWWLNIGNPEVPKDCWRNFRALTTLRFGPLPGERPHMHYRDPKIYRDMYMRQYDRSMIQAIHILRNGLPPKVMQFTPPMTIEMTLDEMIEAIMGAEVMAYMVQDAA
ncbi:hypothetical protein TIFTF001_046008 [Ficus carica]|uniref:Retrotransposon gag domain-containing protein n=1 Tax=Ficus carica TaxID=3494 RepID=A0AA88D3V3_FICCA|nr:hypothetical protein TIFTF001_046008 [Ficus carica]